MSFLAQNCQNYLKRYQSYSGTYLSSVSGANNNNILDRITIYTIWRRSIGLLPLDALLEKYMVVMSHVPFHTQDKGSVHQFRCLECSSQLIPVDPHPSTTVFSQDTVPYPSPAPPKMTATSTFTCIQDGDHPERVSPPSKAAISIPISEIHSKPATNRYPFDNSDPCASRALLFDVKVRDFAFEAHGAKTARVVTMEDSLKYRYTKYRAARQAPPEDIINSLSYYEPEWLEEAEKKPDESFLIEDPNY